MSSAYIPLHRLLRIAAAVFSLNLSCAPAAEPPATTMLTLADAQRLAVERSRQPIARDYAVAASRNMAVAAGRLPDPVLRAGVDNLPANGPERFSLTDDFMTMRRIGVMQELTRAEKRQARSDRFAREADMALAEKSLDIAAIERETALAWIDRYYAEAMAAIVAEQGEQARLELQAAEGAYRAGRGSQADMLAARGALAAFEDRDSDLLRRVRSAKTMLARWTGAAELPLAGKPAIDAIGFDDKALDAQLAHHPEIAVLSRREDLAAAEARIADTSRKADWSVELMYSQRGPAYSNMISFGVSVPLQWDRSNRQDRELAARLALVEQAKAEREEALRLHAAQTRVWIGDWRNGLERIARYERELIPLAKDRTLATIAAYRGGKSGLADVLAARRNEIDVRIDALQLQAETARLWAQLNFLFPARDIALHSPAAAYRNDK